MRNLAGLSTGTGPVAVALVREPLDAGDSNTGPDNHCEAIDDLTR